MIVLNSAWERNQNCECPPLFQFYFLLPLWTHLHHHHHHCRHHDKCRHHDDKCDVLLGCQRPNVLLLQQAPGLKAMSTGVLRRDHLDHFDDLGDHINETGVMWEFLFRWNQFDLFLCRCQKQGDRNSSFLWNREKCKSQVSSGFPTGGQICVHFQAVQPAKELEVT